MARSGYDERMGWRARSAAVVIVASATVLGHAAGPPAPIDRSPEFEAAVNLAVDRGVASLRALQRPDGSYADFPATPRNITGLVYYALRTAGVPEQDATARRAWDATRRLNRDRPLQTYEIATCLLALSQRGESAPTPGDAHARRLAVDERAWAGELAELLIDTQNREGCWGADKRAGPRFDHRNTQVALLGLAAAARCGVRVDDNVWRRALVHFVSAQQRRGPMFARVPADALGPGWPSAEIDKKTGAISDRARGWDVHEDAGSAASAPFTACALSSLAICRRELQDSRKFTSKLRKSSALAVADGLAWLGISWRNDRLIRARALPQAPPAPKLLLIRDSRAAPAGEYYGVERACDAVGVHWIAGVDWYDAGASSLLNSQDPAGGWTWNYSGPEPGAANPAQINQAQINAAARAWETCHGILFLRRATTTVVRPATITPSRAAGTIDFDVAATLEGRDLEDFLDLVLTRWRREKDAAERGHLFDGATRAGPRIVEPLLKRLGSEDENVRRAAHALLRRATAKSFAFDPVSPVFSREAALERWHGWWLSAGSTLRYDSATKRLVAD